MVIYPVPSVVLHSELPGWLIDGILLGLVAAAGVFLVFYVGLRRYGSPYARTSHHDPDALRRAEVRAYLSAIGEVVHERATVEGITVDFYLPDRGVAITFDAGDYLRLADTPVTAILLEHEVPGQQIGARLPFETPSIVTDHPEEDPQQWAREVLEVSDSADAADIEAAYREKIKELHPDVGGDQQALIEVLEAYEKLATK